MPAASNSRVWAATNSAKASERLAQANLGGRRAEAGESPDHRHAQAGANPAGQPFRLVEAALALAMRVERHEAQRRQGEAGREGGPAEGVRQPTG